MRYLRSATANSITNQMAMMGPKRTAHHLGAETLKEETGRDDGNDDADAEVITGTMICSGPFTEFNPSMAGNRDGG